MMMSSLSAGEEDVTDSKVRLDLLQLEIFKDTSSTWSNFTYVNVQEDCIILGTIDRKGRLHKLSLRPKVT